MPAFSTLGLIGLGVSLVGAALRKGKGKETATGRAGSTRTSEGAEIVGKAVPRGSVPPEGLTAAPEAPPSTSQVASAATALARGAGERARKRAAAGGMVLSGRQKGLPPVGGRYVAKTLLGS